MELLFSFLTGVISVDLELVIWEKKEMKDKKSRSADRLLNYDIMSKSCHFSGNTLLYN